MKILMIHNHYRQMGGEDTVFDQETALLQRRGHDVYTYERSNAESMDYGGRQKVAMFWRTTWSDESNQRLDAILRDFQPDVAHFHNTHFTISPAAYYVCQRHRVPVIQTLHNYRLACPKASFHRDGRVCEDCLGKFVALPALRHKCYNQSLFQTIAITTTLTVHRALGTWQDAVDRYIALTDFARDKMIEAGLPARKLIVKPNFLVDDPQLGQATDDPYLVFVGRLSEEKGIRVLLDAARLAPHVPIKLVGGGDLLEEAQAFVSQHGLQQIELLGMQPREDTLAILKGARALVLPSIWYEGLPMVIVEAFACGKPVITSDLGAMSSLIQDGYNGLHHIPGDAEDMAARLRYAWDHLPLLAEMGHHARQTFEAQYTADRNYTLMMALYEEVIREKAASATG